MKYKFPILGFVAATLLLSSCDEEPISDPISPDDYPIATFTKNIDGSELNEGDTVTYTITLDKMMEYDVTFSAEFTDADGETSHEVEILTEDSEVTIPAYSNSGELVFVVSRDDIPEGDETLHLDVAAHDIAERYMLKPETSVLSSEFTIKNYNDPASLTVMLSWPTDDDIDIVTWYLENDTLYELGDGGATGANPEIDTSIKLSYATDYGIDTYYVNFMHWGAAPFDYTITLGHPDGTNEILTGTFDSDNLDKYTEDVWTAWGGGYSSYRILKVMNDGTKFTVTEL